MPIFFYIILPLDLVTSVGLLTVPCFRGYPRLSGGSSRHERGDLSVKAKSVEYVRISSLYGAGFFYIPGTDTCIKLGGYLRVDTTFNGGIYDQPAWSGDLGVGDRYRDSFASRSRMAFTIDTRTATEYGVVRTFGQADFQFDTLGSNTTNPAVLTAAGVNSSLLST